MKRITRITIPVILSLCSDDNSMLFAHPDNIRQ